MEEPVFISPHRLANGVFTIASQQLRPGAPAFYRYAIAFLVVAIITMAGQISLSAQTLPDGFAQTRISHALTQPTAMTIAPDGRAFICQQGGQLRVVKNDVLLSTPFLTVTTDNSGERGLIGITLDPNFSSNGFVYIYYTATTPTLHNRVSRFTANGDVAVPGSEVVLLDIDDLTTFNQHNAGALHFGLDGKLYVAIGDNQNPTNAQSITTLKGKILRLNSDGSIPADNPFFNTASGKNRAIWALGFRNPFTLDVQPGTGRMFINDVGQDGWEEISEGASGGNFGWPYFEGYSSDPSYVSPVFAYPHGTTGCDSIAGGAFYNPATPQFPSEYVGKYFFMDLCNGWMKTLDPNTGEVEDFADGLTTYIVYVTLAPDGSLYYLSVGEPDGLGSVYKIRYTGSLAPAIGTQPADQLVSVGYSATFNISATGYQPLSYQWQKNGSDISGATAASYATPAVSLSDDGAQFRCVVTNSFGAATSNIAILSVTTNQPPSATISAPADGTFYDASDNILFSGTASDPETGSLPASAYTWEVHFQHEAHFHPFMPATTGVTSGSFTIPATGETSSDVWYRIILKVKDSAGLVTTTYRDVLPNKSTITVVTNSPGLLVTVDGQPHTAPYTFTSVVNFTHSLGSFSPQTLNGTTYSFSSWSDAGALTHNISAPASNTTYTATFANARTGTISANPNPIQVCDGSGNGVTNVTWTTSGVTAVEVRLNSPSGTLFAATGAGTETRPTGDWVSEGMVFYLQDRSGGAPLTAANTLGTVTVHLTSNGCNAPTGSISANPNPIPVCDGSTLGTTTVSWNSADTTAVEIHVDSPNGPLFTTSGPGPGSLATGNWVGNGTTFYLQNVSNGLPLTAANTLATVQVGLTNTGCRSGTITANPNPIPVCDGSGLGTTTLSWTTAGVSALEVHLNSPSGSLFSRIGPSATKATGKWVTQGMVFYLQDVSNGLPLTAANTLGTVTANLTTNGCVSISQQPANQTAVIGQAATFSVSAGGAAPLSYQWQRNGVNISGATAASYTIASATAADNGAQFRCIVTNANGSVTSNSASLTVNVMLTLASSPSGLRLLLDGQTQNAPVSIISQLGASHALGVISPQTLNGLTYLFNSWSDGGPASHNVAPNNNTTYTATFFTNNAAFVSQSVPNGSLKKGQQYTVSVTMRNTGTSTWTASNNYRLGSQNPQDNLTWSLNRVNLPSSVAPGANCTFTFTITAPSASGDYNFQWKMIHEGVGWFGAASTNAVLKVR